MIRKVLVGVDLDYVVDLDEPDMLEATKELVREQVLRVIENDALDEYIIIKEPEITDEQVHRTKDHLAR